MNRIKELRLGKGLKQVDVAKALNIAQNTLSTWESGKHEPDLAALKELATYFDVSTDYLLGESDDPSNQKKEAPAIAETPTDDEFIAFYDSLLPEEQARVIEMARLLFPEKALLYHSKNVFVHPVQDSQDKK